MGILWILIFNISYLQFYIDQERYAQLLSKVIWILHITTDQLITQVPY